MNKFLLLTLFLLPLGLNAQLTNMDIWASGNLSSTTAGSFNFLKKSSNYTVLEDGKIIEYDLTTGDQASLLFDPIDITDDTATLYRFSPEQKKILLGSEIKYQYRRSYYGEYKVYNPSTGEVTSLMDGKRIREVTFSPDGEKVAWVYENNLYTHHLSTGNVTQITYDGEKNQIINGATDWVYEEEFGFTQAYEWSPGGRYIAWLKFDESEVPEFMMPVYTDELYPVYESFKYPKVGMTNSTVTLHLYDHKKEEKERLNLPNDLDEYYIPRLTWTNDKEKLVVHFMNRHQNHLRLILIDVEGNNWKVLLNEKHDQWIDIHDNLYFLDDDDRFIWMSDRDGFDHLYLYNLEGELIRQITKGDFEVTKVYGYNQNDQRIYYQANKQNPFQREVYSINLKGRKEIVIAGKPGWNSADFSTDFKTYVYTYSNINTPPEVVVRSTNGETLRVLATNKNLIEVQDNEKLAGVEFFDFTTDYNVKLNGLMFKPADFSASKKYPLLMFVYGGPGSQQVVDRWKGAYYWWFQMLTQQGYIVAIVDNRGTGGRGSKFEKQTYLRLGELEVKDQAAAAKYLQSLLYIKSEKTGIMGWSYGGYMALLCILKYPQLFEAAVSIAPVTNWKWYDTIYTERFMRTLAENEEGYRQNSPVYFAENLEGELLLVHGIADDNVHFQHTAEMAKELIRYNKQFDTYFYPNRNHGIHGNNARIHLFQKVTDFLYESL